MEQQVSDLARVAAQRAVILRRDLHRHPELGWTEFRTASLVARRLEEVGVLVRLGPEVLDSGSRMGVPGGEELERAYRRAEEEGADPKFLSVLRGGFTAVVGEIEGSERGPVVALRVDMDALPITEDASDDHRPTREGFASVHRGVMHACGHDAHTAIGVAVAEVLAMLRHQIRGKVKVIFQPAEEGGRGAIPMVKAGVVDDVDFFLGLHVGLGAPSGTFYPMVEGFLSSTKFDVVFRGAAAHAGARPEEGRNALLGAAQATLGMHAISRHHAGRTRVNVGVLSAGAGRNVIPDYAFISAETRGDSDELNEFMFRRAQAIVRGAAEAFELEYEIRQVGATATAKCDVPLSEAVGDIASVVPGLKVIRKPLELGAGDDATYFMRRVQESGGMATYVVIGSDIPSGHHTPRFDINEADLGPAVHAIALTILMLGHKPPRYER